MTARAGDPAHGRTLRGEWVDALLPAEAPDHRSRLCDRHGIPANAIREPMCRIPLDDFSAELQHLAELRREPLIGIRQAARARPRDLFYYLMAAQDRVSTALDHLVRFGDLLLAGTPIRLEMGSRGEAQVVWPTLDAAHRHVSEAALMMLRQILVEIAGPELRCEEVALHHGAIAPLADYESAFGCPVRFDRSAHRLVLSAAALDLRTRRPNSQVAERLRRFATREREVLASGTTRERVQLVLRAAFEDGADPSHAAVAQRLVSPPQRLQRALRREGTSFHAIAQAVRLDLAIRLLKAGELTLAEVAQHLGFADKSSFFRAFKRWTGRAPGAFVLDSAANS